MPLRLGRRPLAALAATVLGATALAVGIAAPALASPHVAPDGSAGRPTATSGTSSVLGLQLGGQSLSVNVAGVSIDPGALVRGLTGGNASPSPGATPSASAPASVPVPAPTPRSDSAGVPPTSQRSRPASRQRAIRHRASADRTSRRARAAGGAQVAAAVHRVSARTMHRTSRPARHQRQQVVGKRHRLLGSQVLEDVVRPGSPAQILILLVIMCAIGTAFMVSLARRKEPKPVRVRSRSQHR